MKLPKAGVSLVIAAFASGVVHAADRTSESTPPQASIPFVQYNGIRDWKADHTRGLWIQDSRRDWYYAKLMGPCFGLDFATRIAFDARPGGTFDRFSSIIVPREGRCIVQSIVASEPPPRKHAIDAKPKDDTSGET
jgi:hypothetical protein